MFVRLASQLSGVRCALRETRARLCLTRGTDSSARLLAMSALVCPTASWGDLMTNCVFMTGFWAFLLAQVGKVFTERFKKGKWDIRAMVSPGGTPSSHASLCAGVTTAIGLSQGLGSPLFAAATAFSLVVMYDAMGVRWHAGIHAQVLNRVVCEINDTRSLGSIADVQLKEVLGHTPRQVLAGAVLGIMTGIFYPALSNRWA